MGADRFVRKPRISTKLLTYRLLTALESEELIKRDTNSDVYRLGPFAITLGSRALRANDLRTLCQPELKKLAALAKETASLELLVDKEIFILDEATADRVISGGQEIGSRWPAHATSTGKAMLAALPDERLEELLPGLLTAVTPHTLTNPTIFRQELAKIRTRGYAIADEELEIGLVAVAAPILNYDKEAVAAISLAAPKVRLDAERIAELGQQVQAAARRISVQLGYPVIGNP
ncbi:MAG: IclR family transcriptional regulator [Ardenticatenaceae bacterium]|nr:IclR family transcriptional regulator [Ardenticatenaceae bacterium]